jgi:hypothetical protein
MSLRDTRPKWRDFVVTAWRAGVGPWLLGRAHAITHIRRLAQVRRYVLTPEGQEAVDRRLSDRRPPG